MLPDWIKKEEKVRLFGDRADTDIQNTPTNLQTYWFREANLSGIQKILEPNSKVLIVGGSAVEAASFVLGPQVERFTTIQIGISEYLENSKLKKEVDYFIKFLHEYLSDYLGEIEMTSLINQLVEMSDEVDEIVYAEGAKIYIGFKAVYTKETVSQLLNLVNRIKSVVDSILEQLLNVIANPEVVGEYRRRFNLFLNISPSEEDDKRIRLDVFNSSDIEIHAGNSNRFKCLEGKAGLASEKIRLLRDNSLLNATPNPTDNQSNFEELSLPEDLYKRLRFIKGNALGNISEQIGDTLYDGVLINNVLLHYPSAYRRLIIANTLNCLEDGGILALENFYTVPQDGSAGHDYKYWLTDKSNYEDLGLELFKNQWGLYFKYTKSNNIFAGKDLKVDDGHLVSFSK